MSASRASQTLRRRVLLAGAGVGLALAAGTTAFFLVPRPSRQPKFTPTPLQRDASGRIIPPTFPKPKSRQDHFDELRRHASDKSDEPYDLLIIGGGATGTGIALDAATRGLRVALVERDDFSSGASSKSTKLVHGGVRYLEKAFWNLDYEQYALVKEALRERKTFLDIAPHLTRSIPFLLPVYSWWQLPYFWAGTKAYEVLASIQGMGLESSYAIGRRESLQAFPLLKKEGLVGSLVYYDGQQNDSRMNVALAMTAAQHGATVVNHVEVTALEKDRSGRICGARLRDTLPEGSACDRSDFVVRAKGVVNATGPYADAIEKMDDPSRKDMVAPSSGVHIVLPGELSPKNMGVLEPATSDGRVIFFLPWEGKTLAGTTDTPCQAEAEPVPTQKEIDFILKELRHFISPNVTVTRDDVLSAWSGIRPLVRDPKAKNTESVVRNHLVTVSDSGLLTCAGGKWTTYRQMAEDAVDEAIHVFSLKPTPSLARSQTRDIPLVGAAGFSSDLADQIRAHFGLANDVAEHLASNYGDRAWEVASGSTSRLAIGLPFVEAEIRYSVRNEMAQTAADVLARRMRLAFLDVQSALEALPSAVDAMSGELGWDHGRKEEEWTRTVGFLASMGLPEHLYGITREQVEQGEHRPDLKSLRPSASFGRGEMPGLVFAPGVAQFGSAKVAVDDPDLRSISRPGSL